MVDTRTLANGPHRLQVAVSDVADNRTLTAPVTVDVENDGVPNGGGATRSATLSGRLDGSHEATPLRRRLRYGAATRFGGRLAESSGGPRCVRDACSRVPRAAGGASWKAQPPVMTRCGWHLGGACTVRPVARRTRVLPSVLGRLGAEFVDLRRGDRQRRRAVGRHPASGEPAGADSIRGPLARRSRTGRHARRAVCRDAPGRRARARRAPARGSQRALRSSIGSDGHEGVPRIGSGPTLRCRAATRSPRDDRVRSPSTSVGRADPMRSRLLLASIAMAFGLASMPAHAEPYTVYGCTLPGGDSAPTNGWTWSVGDSPLVLLLSDCQNPNPGTRSMLAGIFWEPFANLPSETTAGDRAEWKFSAPADTVVAGYTIFRYAASDGIASRWTGEVDTWRGVDWYDDSNPPKRIDGCNYAVDRCRAQGIINERIVPGNADVRDGLSTRWLNIVSHCASPTADHCVVPEIHAETIYIFQTRMRLEDVVSPVIVSGPSGGLFGGLAPVTGVQAVAVTATDRGGGLEHADLFVDGRSSRPPHRIRLSPTWCGARVELVPCPLRGQFALQSTREGRQRPACGAGPRERHQRQRRRNGVGDGDIEKTAPRTACGPPASRLDGRLDGAHDTTPLSLTVGYGKPARLTGRLAGPSGEPIAVPGSRRRSASAPRGELARRRLRHLGPDGQWTFAVPPGPRVTSRSVTRRSRSIGRPARC